MKRLLTIFAILFSGIAVAQDCNSMWPYMFDEFTEGTIYFVDGQAAKRKVNIHYIASDLHYLDKSTIKHTEGSKIRSVSVEGQDFIYIEGALIKVEAARPDGFVGSVTLVDLDRLNEATGAYGTTSNVSSTRELSSMEDIGGTSTNTNHMELTRNREGGRTLYLETQRYLVLYNSRYKATKAGVSRALSKDAKKAFKSFEKSQDIDWNDPESILKVIDFLKDNID